MGIKDIYPGVTLKYLPQPGVYSVVEQRRDYSNIGEQTTIHVYNSTPYEYTDSPSNANELYWRSPIRDTNYSIPLADLICGDLYQLACIEDYK